MKTKNIIFISILLIQFTLFALSKMKLNKVYIGNLLKANNSTNITNNQTETKNATSQNGANNNNTS